MPRRRFDPVDAAFMLPVAFAGMLLIGVLAVAEQLHGRAVLVLTSVLVAATALLAEPAAAAPLAAVGWFTVAGFSHAPYGDLHATGGIHTGVVLTGGAAAAVGLGTLYRWNRGRQIHDTQPGSVTL